MCVSCNTDDNDGILDFTHTYMTLTNTGNLSVGMPVYVLLGTMTFRESDVHSTETDNLGPFTISFQLSGYDAFSIATTSMTANSSANTATAVFSSAYQYVTPTGPLLYPTVGARISFSNSAYDQNYTWDPLQCGSSDTVNIYAQIQYFDTPEPATFILLGSALLGLGLLGRRRRKA